MSKLSEEGHACCIKSVMGILSLSQAYSQCGKGGIFKEVGMVSFLAFLEKERDSQSVRWSKAFPSTLLHGGQEGAQRVLKGAGCKHPFSP